MAFPADLGAGCRAAVLQCWRRQQRQAAATVALAHTLARIRGGVCPLVITGEVITLEMGPNNNKAQKFNAQTSSLRAHAIEMLHEIRDRSLALFWVP